jgi:two-component system, NarL family, response regulator NreC
MLRIVVADDHTLFREGIRALLSTEHDMDIVGEAADGAAAITLAESLRADVVIMDVSMPGISSFEAARRIKQGRPATSILFLSMYDDQDYISRAMESGANGYVVKDSPAQELIAAIREVSRGGNYLSPRLVSGLVDAVRSHAMNPPEASRFETLTARERETLKMLAEGRSVKEIAGEFGLSAKTVDTHKFHVMRKLGVHNRAQLVQYAIHNNVIRINALPRK